MDDDLMDELLQVAGRSRQNTGSKRSRRAPSDSQEDEEDDISDEVFSLSNLYFEA
jgi:hypothetical protein